MVNVNPPGAGVSGPTIYIDGTLVAGGIADYLLKVNSNGSLGQTPASGIVVPIVVGTTPITGGTNGYLLYDDNGDVGVVSPNLLSITSTGSTTARTLADRAADVYDARDYGLDEAGDPEDNMDAIQAACDAAAAARGLAVVRKGLYEVSGELDTSTNLHLIFEGGAVLKPVGWSDSGSIITNLVTSVSPLTIQSNIIIEGLQMDFSDYPRSPIGTAQGGSATTIVLDASDDGTTNGESIAARLAAGKGVFIRLIQGTGSQSAAAAITAFTGGAGGTVTVAGWSGAAPVAGTVYQWGWNDNAIGFTGGVSDVRVYNTRVTNIMGGMFTNGGSKGINFEQGAERFLVDGVFVEGLAYDGVDNAGEYGCVTAVFVQGRSGVWGNGSSRNAILGIVKNVFATNCGAAVAVGGADTSEPPSGDPEQELIIVDGVTFRNCGHMPQRFVGTDQQKGGAVLLFRAQNVLISNVNGFNDSDYPETLPGYPTTYTAQVGYGLTGPIGAVVWGWGRNITIDSVAYHGNADSLVRINRARVIGEDAAAQGSPGEVTNVLSFKVTNLRHWGTVDNVVAVDSTASMRVANANLLLNVQADTETITTGIVAAVMNGYTNTVLDVYDRTTNTRIQGTADQIFDAGNTVATYAAAKTNVYGYQFWDALTAAAGTTALPSIKSPTDETGVAFPAAATMSVTVGGTYRWAFNQNTLRGSSAAVLGFSDGLAGATTVVGLSYGGGAGIMALGNGTAGNATGTLNAANFNGILGATTPAAATVTTLTASGQILASDGTAALPAVTGSSAAGVAGLTFLSNGSLGISSNGLQRIFMNGAAVRIPSTGIWAMTNAGANGTTDTGLSRGGAAAIVSVGNGTAGDTSGTLRAAALAAGGSDFTVTAANSVSPTSPNRTITISYNGTTYYLAAKTTND